MKFLIFTCLLAVALAKHKMETSSSSEESVNISQEKFKHERNVIIHPIKESAENTKEMESAEVPTEESASFSQEKTKLAKENKNNQKRLNKMAQYHQKFPLPKYFQTVQHQPAMNPFTNVYQTIPNVV
uniref:Alpha-S2-casein n=1 Tax=Myotis myotis TaxID=51298 RepID=A0A7J8AK13_MYOMY|nr:hypothetical protein mMyoMyo1_003397 [Myotis myotis]